MYITSKLDHSFVPNARRSAHDHGLRRITQSAAGKIFVRAALFALFRAYLPLLKWTTTHSTQFTGPYSHSIDCSEDFFKCGSFCPCSQSLLFPRLFRQNGTQRSFFSPSVTHTPRTGSTSQQGWILQCQDLWVSVPTLSEAASILERFR